MAIIKPFRALRPIAEKAKQVSCAPYDVVNEREAREFLRQNPLSFLSVTRPEAGFSETQHPSEKAVSARAEENLQKFIADGVFAMEAEPCVYIYRLASRTHTQTGVVACCSLDEYELGIIKKHEKTRPDKVQERTEHMLALRAQTGLIFLAFRNTETIKNLIAEAVGNKPIYDFFCANNVRQTIWRIALTEDFVRAFESVPALYIADGHHRIESANLARKVLREQNAQHSGAEDYNFVVAGMFPAEDLMILPYNRVVKDLNDFDESEFLARLEENFVVSETIEKSPSRHGEFCMYLSGKWFKLKPANDFAESRDPFERLDVTILQNRLLAPILGIHDARTDDRLGFVGGARGVVELEKAVDEGAARVAFSMFATTMDDLFAVSDADEIMPPKSTWFEPKLKDGLLVYLI